MRSRAQTIAIILSKYKKKTGTRFAAITRQQEFVTSGELNTAFDPAGVATPAFRSWIEDISDAVGWKGTIDLAPGDGPPLLVAGKVAGVEGGHFLPQEDHIKIYVDSLNHDQLVRIVSHEATHALFKYAMKEIDKQDAQLRMLRLERKDQIANGAMIVSKSRAVQEAWAAYPFVSAQSFQIVPELKERFPLYHAMRALFETPFAKTGQLVSSYAKTWLQTFEKGDASQYQAINETIAEIGAEKAFIMKGRSLRGKARMPKRGGVRTQLLEKGISKEWLDYHQAIVDAGAKLARTEGKARLSVRIRREELF